MSRTLPKIPTNKERQKCSHIFHDFLVPRLLGYYFEKDIKWSSPKDGTFRLRIEPTTLSLMDRDIFQDWIEVNSLQNKEDPMTKIQAATSLHQELNKEPCIEMKHRTMAYQYFQITNPKLKSYISSKTEAKVVPECWQCHMRTNNTSTTNACECWLNKNATPLDLPRDIFEEEESTNISDAYNIFCTQIYPYETCWYTLDGNGDLHLT
ncbi:uncharacterized protein LOC144113581 isoform X2 [Amblyomma americanum]